MSIFRNRNRPRALHELRVGPSHTVEILFQLRRGDWEWYSTNEQDIEEEILELLSESVIPRMFGDVIEEYHMERHPHLFPDKIQVGSKNKNLTSNNNNKNDTKATSKRKSRKGGSKAASLMEQSDDKRPEKDIYYSFGEKVQLAYRKTPLLSPSIHTIFSKDGEEDAFEGFIKLPSRLLIWISKMDPQNKTNPDPPGVGFHRPEMIPISALFRQPQDEDEDVDT